ncbi:MAG: hypothetical protein DRI99_08650 [Candidatus Aminicenantes bacterium]|nr:MAG: hypothetical protein DRI99_08650 [Candidatus Aminicenantes bacterium]
MAVKVFLAGIMQGSRREPSLYNQDYRQKIKQILAEIKSIEIYCPYEKHPRSLSYDQAKLKKVFLDHLRQAAEADVLIAYLPEASMGTALEIWEASRAGRIILTISPLAENWVIKALATHNFVTLEEFADFVLQGKFESLLRVYLNSGEK